MIFRNTVGLRNSLWLLFWFQTVKGKQTGCRIIAGPVPATVYTHPTCCRRIRFCAVLRTRFSAMFGQDPERWAYNHFVDYPRSVFPPRSSREMCRNQIQGERAQSTCHVCLVRCILILNARVYMCMRPTVFPFNSRGGPITTFRNRKIFVGVFLSCLFLFVFFRQTRTWRGQPILFQIVGTYIILCYNCCCNAMYIRDFANLKYIIVYYSASTKFTANYYISFPIGIIAQIHIILYNISIVMERIYFSQLTIDIIVYGGHFL